VLDRVNSRVYGDSLSINDAAAAAAAAGTCRAADAAKSGDDVWSDIAEAV